MQSFSFTNKYLIDHALLYARSGKTIENNTWSLNDYLSVFQLQVQSVCMYLLVGQRSRPSKTQCHPQMHECKFDCLDPGNRISLVKWDHFYIIVWMEKLIKSYWILPIIVLIFLTKLREDEYYRPGNFLNLQL